jgi:hypothetical protein
MSPAPIAQGPEAVKPDPEPEIRHRSRVWVQTVPFSERHQAITKPRIRKTYKHAITDPLHGIHGRGAIEHSRRLLALLRLPFCSTYIVWPTSSSNSTL